MEASLVGEQPSTSSSAPGCAFANLGRTKDLGAMQERYADVLEGAWPSEPWRLPLVYNKRYNVSFFGLEKLHPFDSCKFEKILATLKDKGHVDAKGRQLVTPKDPGTQVLADVHTEQYLQEVHSSNFRVAQVTELQPIVMLPRWLVQWRVVTPMRVHAAGTMVAAALAVQHGWSINIGGGMHHASRACGMGWCMFDDITLAVRRLRVASDGRIQKVLYIDLDAHQGNGVEQDKLAFDDEDLCIVDLYNGGIFPRDDEAKAAIDVDVPLRSGTPTEAYLARLEEALGEVEAHPVGGKPDLVVYNAGTDVLEGDPLGRLSVSREGIQKRDEMVWRLALRLGAPIMMTLSGGYARENAQVVAESLDHLFTTFGLGRTATEPVPP